MTAYLGKVFSPCGKTVIEVFSLQMDHEEILGMKYRPVQRRSRK
jgi:hypothetical protein